MSTRLFVRMAAPNIAVSLLLLGLGILGGWYVHHLEKSTAALVALAVMDKPEAAIATLLATLAAAVGSLLVLPGMAMIHRAKQLLIRLPLDLALRSQEIFSDLLSRSIRGLFMMILSGKDLADGNLLFLPYKPSGVHLPSEKDLPLTSLPR